MNNNRKIVEQILLIAEQSNVNMVDAVIEWCERNNIDFEFAGNILKKNASFKRKIKVDAAKLNLLKG